MKTEMIIILGKVTGQNKQDFMYGKLLFLQKYLRVKVYGLPWMMPTDESYYGQWPKCGEIDIMEVLGHQTILFTVLFTTGSQI